MRIAESVDRRVILARTTWLGLTRGWVLAVTGGGVFLLFLCARFVEQMPGQLHDDPAEAARWLLVASEQYGPLGNVMRTLGLFNVLHNPLLQLLIMIITLVLFIRLGNLLAAAWRLYQVTRWLAHPVSLPGEPVALPVVQPLYRLRQAVNSPPDQVVPALQQELAARFPEQQTTTLLLPTPNAETTEAEQGATPLEEARIVALRYLRHALLRPLLLVGLFVGLLAVWLLLIAGWEVAPPLLAPGEQYHGGEQQVTVTYPPPLFDNLAPPELQVQTGEVTTPLALNSTIRSNWWQLAIGNQIGPPALFLQTADQAALLSQPGQIQALPQLGLIFPSVGSEELVVVDQRLVLRLVRLVGTSEQPGITAYWVEVYQVDADEPVLRLEIPDRSRQTFTVDEQSYTIEFILLPSIQLDLRYQPGIWLLGLALVLVVIGAVGYRVQPAFVLAQIAPWPTKRTVVIIQSDTEQEVESLRAWLAQAPFSHQSTEIG